MRLVAYARVSTNGQALHGVSVPDQLRTITEWAAVEGHTIIAEYTDNGISGRVPWQHRPGLARALLDIEEGRSKLRLAREVDRLAREAHVQEAILTHVWHHGGHVFTVDGEILQDDPNDPYHTFIRQVMGAAAQLEASLVRKRLQRGRRLKHERGGYSGRPTVRFDQRVEGTGKSAKRVPDPEHAAVVELMHQLRSEGLTYRQIADQLNATGTETARGGRWHAMTIKRTLASKETS